MNKQPERNSRKSLNGHSDCQLDQKPKVISLYLNIETPEQTNKMIKNNFQSLGDLGCKQLPKVRKTVDQQTQTENLLIQKTPSKTQKEKIIIKDNDDLNELLLEKRQTSCPDLVEQNYQDLFDKAQTQTLQFFPTGEMEQQLTREIKSFIQSIDQYHQQNKPLFDKLIAQISKIASDTFKGSTIEIFGSFATELCLPQSDLDLVIRVSPDQKYYADLLKQLELRLQV